MIRTITAAVVTAAVALSLTAALHTNRTVEADRNQQLARQYTFALNNGADATTIAKTADGVCEIIYYPTTGTYQCETK